MKVVSTSNLVFSETGKTTTAYNFQNMAMNSFVMPRYLMGGQIGRYAYMQIHKIAKSKPTSNKLKEKNCFNLKMHYFLQ